MSTACHSFIAVDHTGQRGPTTWPLGLQPTSGALDLRSPAAKSRCRHRRNSQASTESRPDGRSWWLRIEKAIASHSFDVHQYRRESASEPHSTPPRCSSRLTGSCGCSDLPDSSKVFSVAVPQGRGVAITARGAGTWAASRILR